MPRSGSAGSCDGRRSLQEGGHPSVNIGHMSEPVLIHDQDWMELRDLQELTDFDALSDAGSMGGVLEVLVPGRISRHGSHHQWVLELNTQERRQVQLPLLDTVAGQNVGRNKPCTSKAKHFQREAKSRRSATVTIAWVSD